MREILQTGSTDLTSVRGGKVVLTDELLDHLADRFIFYQVRQFIGISFGQFLNNPEYYLRKTVELIRAALNPEYMPMQIAWDRPDFNICFPWAEEGHA